MKKIISLLFLFFMLTLITGCGENVSSDIDTSDIDLDDIDIEIEGLDDDISSDLDNIESNLDLI